MENRQETLSVQGQKRVLLMFFIPLRAKVRRKLIFFFAIFCSNSRPLGLENSSHFFKYPHEPGDNTSSILIGYNHAANSCLLCFSYVIPTDNKQLLDEVEHDIMNYQNRGLCYLPKPKAEADNTDTRF